MPVIQPQTPATEVSSLSNSTMSTVDLSQSAKEMYEVFKKNGATVTMEVTNGFHELHFQNPTGVESFKVAGERTLVDHKDWEHLVMNDGQVVREDDKGNVGGV